jgi:hypothetical protein
VELDVNEVNEELLEALAELEHEQWIAWAKSVSGSEPLLTSERRNRWRKLMVPYSELPEEIKELDRIQARKVLALIEQGGGFNARIEGRRKTASDDGSREESEGVDEGSDAGADVDAVAAPSAVEEDYDRDERQRGPDRPIGTFASRVA